MKAKFRASDLLLVGHGFPWSERPAVGESVQINSGGPRMLIEGFDGEDALLRTPSGGEERMPWVCLKPWMLN